MTIHQLKRLTTAARHTSQRILRYYHWQTGLSGYSLVEVGEQGTATGQNNARLGNICGLFWWRLLQCQLHRAHHGFQRLFERAEDFVVGQRKAARDALGQVAATHIDLFELV